MIYLDCFLLFDMLLCFTLFFFFFFNDTATTEIYTLSLHDALPICLTEFIQDPGVPMGRAYTSVSVSQNPSPLATDRKSTRLNSSHLVISYAVFCLKKKKKSHIKRVTSMQSNM